MIEDEELRRLFKAEADEHIAGLEAGLLRLEQGGADGDLLDRVFRDAHSLKGAARMLDLQPIESLLHAMEEPLRAARDGRRPPSATAIDALLGALDHGKSLVAEAVGELPRDAGEGPDLATLIGALERVAAAESAAGEAPVAGSPARVSRTGTEQHAVPVAASPPAALPKQDGATAPALVADDEGSTEAASMGATPQGDALAEPASETAADTATDRGAELTADLPLGSTPIADATAPGLADGADGWRIDSIRVATDKLDVLLRQCGELIVGQQRIARLSGDLGQLADTLVGSPSAAGPGTGTVGDGESTALVERLHALRDRLDAEGRRLETLALGLADGVRDARLLPLSTLFDQFPRMLRDLARAEGKQVRLVVEGEEVTADKQIVERLKDPLMHLLRNAVHHGIEAPEERLRAGKPAEGRVLLEARRVGASVRIEVADDGRGIDPSAVRAAIERLEGRPGQGDRTPAGAAGAGADSSDSGLLEGLFRPGLSTERMITDVSGRGVGLDVVRAGVERLKGRLQVGSEPGRSFRLRMELPITLATTRVLLLAVAGFKLALPIDAARSLLRLRPGQVYTLEGRPAIDWRGRALSVLALRRAFGLHGDAARGDADGDGGHAVVVEHGARCAAVLVDEIQDAQDVLLRPLGGVLRRLRGVAGATILSSGEVCPVLSAADLLAMAADLAESGPRPAAAGAEPAQVLLLVDDSMLTRLQEKRMLEGAGYRVATAVDGQDAWERLRASSGPSGHGIGGRGRGFDGVVSDIDMPRLDGLALTARIRADEHLRRLPVVLVTALATAEDRRRGLEAGADAYITKGDFENRLLLSTLERLL